MSIVKNPGLHFPVKTENDGSAAEISLKQNPIQRTWLKLKNIYVRTHLRTHNVSWSGSSPSLEGRMPFFRIEGRMSMGSHCRLYGTAGHRSIFDVREKACLTVGNRCGFNIDVHISVLLKITIGDHLRCGPGVRIFDTNFHEIGPDDPVTPGPVVIGRNVWLCSNAMVMRGAEIGDHSVVSAGTIVKGKIPPRSRVEGNPMRITGQIECPDDWVRV